MFNDDDFSGKLRSRLEILKDIENAHNRITQAENSTILTQETINKYVGKQLEDLKKLATELKKVNAERLSGLAREQSSLKSMSSIYSELTALEEKRILDQAESITLTTVQDAAISKIAEINRDIAQLTADETLQLIALNHEYDMQMQLLEGINAENVQLVDNLKLQNTLANTYASATAGQKEFLEKQHEVYKGIKNTLMGIFDVAQVATSGLTGGIGTALIGAGMLFDKFVDIKKELGQFPSLSLAALSFFDKNAVDNAKNLASQFGGINNVTFDMQLSTSLISKNMKITGDEAADLLGMFARLNDNSFDTAKNIMVSTKEFAKQNGIIPSKLFSEMAKNTEAFAKFSKDGGKNLIEAAGAAMKLGTDLSTTVKISEGLLDFETSINKELELGAMLGRNINLDRARALAFQGKTTEATKEALKAIGGIDAFNKMDPIARQAAADLLGIQVDELQKQLSLQDKSAVKNKTALDQYNAMGQAFEAFTTEFGGGFLKALGSGFLTLGSFSKEMNAIKTLTDNIGKTKLGSLVYDKLSLGYQKLRTLFTGKELTFAQKRALVENRQAKLGQKSISTPSTKTPATGAGGKNQGDGLVNLAKGLTAMGTVQVLFGAANLIVAAIGFIAIIPGIPGIILIGKFGTEAGEGLMNLAIGLEFMGTGKVSGGAGNLILAGLGFVAMTAGIIGFGAVAFLGAKAGAGLIALGGGLASFGATAGTVGWLGVAVILALGAAFTLFAFGLSLLAPLVESIGNAIGSVVESIAAGIVMIVGSISDLLVNVLPLLNVGAAVGILAMAAAFATLAGSLSLLGTIGSVAIPVLMVAGAVGGIAGSLFGGDSETTGGGGDTNMKELLDEIRGLRNDLTGGKVGVYMDGTKVNMALARGGDRIGINQYLG
jgi:hypothetical protein